jgi:hypothetical protein
MMHRLVLLFAVLAVGIAPVTARTLSFPPQSSGVVQFKTPAGEIGCTYIPFDGAGGIKTGVKGPELHCYRLIGKFLAFSIGPDGRMRKLVVEGKLDCCKGGNVLAYGSTWETGGFACTAIRGGIRCKRGKNVVSIGPVIREWPFLPKQ